MKSPKYCLDTHPLVWYFAAQKTLSSKGKKIIDDIFSGKADCILPTIVLLEVYHICLKRKNLDFPKFLEHLNLPNIYIVPLDKTILIQCYKLSPKLDIHDRVIAATAIINGSILLTKDREIKRFSTVETIW